MKRLLLAIGCCVLFASCYKDNVQIDKLTTNPMDPDYSGPPIFTVLTDSTYTPTPGVHEQYLKIKVDDEVLPIGLTYKLRVIDLEDGAITDLQQTSPGANVFQYFNAPVDLGTTYCYDISLWVQESASRKEQYCGIAQL